MPINYEFFCAVDGSHMPKYLERMIDDRHRIIWRSRPLSVGERGVYASNYLLWKKCIDLNEPIAIAEDDLTIFANFQSSINRAKELASKGVDYIRLSEDLDNLPKVAIGGYDDILHMPNNQSGATICYVISPRGARKLIKNSNRWLCSVDNFVGEAFRTKLPCIILKYPSCTIASFESTIQRGEKSKVILPFKLTRELYRFYRFARLEIWNRALYKKYMPKTQ